MTNVTSAIEFLRGFLFFSVEGAPEGQVQLGDIRREINLANNAVIERVLTRRETGLRLGTIVEFKASRFAADGIRRAGIPVISSPDGDEHYALTSGAYKSLSRV
jgi:hypothetical protein